jgi:hypothetical protein
MMMSETKRDFDELLMESVHLGLKQVLGEASAKCVTFYIDPHLAVADPDNYARSLLGLFGTATKALLDAVLASLQEKTGVARGSAESFGKIVSETRQSYEQREQITA